MHAKIHASPCLQRCSSDAKLCSSTILLLLLISLIVSCILSMNFKFSLCSFLHLSPSYCPLPCVLSKPKAIKESTPRSPRYSSIICLENEQKKVRIHEMHYFAFMIFADSGESWNGLSLHQLIKSAC